MDATDVVVVGAGPAGSATAYFLAVQGINVTVVDESKFPREKISGDGVGPRALVMLEKMGVLDWISSGHYYRCNKVRFFASNDDYFEAAIPFNDAKYTHFYVAPRCEVDYKLIQNAVSAGAIFLPECKAISIERSNGVPSAVRVIAGGQEEVLPCKAIVCADGTHGTFAFHTGIAGIKPQAMAVRAYYSNISGLDECVNVLIDKQIPKGYAWVFPISHSTANIGLGISTAVLRKQKPDVNEMMDRFIREREIGPVDINNAVAESEIKGTFLRMGSRRCTDVVADGVLFAGDAAALAGPLSGEGIAQALESGEPVASTVLSAFKANDFSTATLRQYQRDLSHNHFRDNKIRYALRQSLLFSNGILFDNMVNKGIRHVNFAEKFVSVMASTAHPTEILNPRYLRYFL